MELFSSGLLVGPLVDFSSFSILFGSGKNGSTAGSVGLRSLICGRLHARAVSCTGDGEAVDSSLHEELRSPNVPSLPEALLGERLSLFSLARFLDSSILVLSLPDIATRLDIPRPGDPSLPRRDSSFIKFPIRFDFSDTSACDLDLCGSELLSSCDLALRVGLFSFRGGLDRESEYDLITDVVSFLGVLKDRGKVVAVSGGLLYFVG